MSDVPMTSELNALFNAARNLSARAPVHPNRLGIELPPLFVMSDEQRLTDPISVAASLPAGCGFVLRHYSLPHRASLAALLAKRCRENGVVCMIGGDLDLATSVQADGLHLPEHATTKFTRPPGIRILTAAAHSAAALKRAASSGADLAFLSPVIPTNSHPGRKTLGPKGFANLANASPLPVYALGGITNGTVGMLSNSGAAGIALTGAAI